MFNLKTGTILLGMFIVIIFLGILPIFTSAIQIKNQTQIILNQPTAYKYGFDRTSKDFLKKHSKLQLKDVSDAQGNDGNLEYHLGTTTTGYNLGILVHYDNPHNPYSKITIHSIRIWNPTKN